MQRILSIIGTRPEAIKMAPVIKALEAAPGSVQSLVCVTGQHRQILDSMLEFFGIRADFDLNVMRPGQDLSGLTARLFDSLGPVVEQTKPDWILAQGDTTTVLVASLVAFYHRVAFGHVEAGLRTGDCSHPFPEEMNRRVADLVANVCFAPTERGRQALLKEGFPPDRVFVVGNTVVDALLEAASRPYDWHSGPLAQIPTDKPLVLITAHRRESFGPAFREICLAIADLARQFESAGVQFVYPVHLNPHVRQPVNAILKGIPNVRLLEPIDYLSMVNLMKRATLILTDSGGIQEEAPSFGVPVLVMRDATERPEGVEAGVIRLVGTERASIVRETVKLLSDPAVRVNLPQIKNPYGDGQAAGRIVSILLQQKPAPAVCVGPVQKACTLPGGAGH